LDRQKFNVVICEDLEDLSLKASQHITRYLVQQAEFKPRVSLGLSGGSTPEKLYQYLSRDPFKNEIPWNRLHLFWGDERCVPPDDPRSNFGMARDSLISKIPIPPENFHPIAGEEPDPHYAAHQYETHLRHFFDPPPWDWPRFDLMLLGIGSDGHTASLFPGEGVLEENKRWVCGVNSEKLEIPRLTLTFPVFNHASQILFLAAGMEKAPVLKNLTSHSSGSSALPYTRVQPSQGQLFFFLDKASASQMTHSSKR
jgi:6-phosphogluconolactonase